MNLLRLSRSPDGVETGDCSETPAGDDAVIEIVAMEARVAASVAVAVVVAADGVAAVALVLTPRMPGETRTATATALCQTVQRFLSMCSSVLLLEAPPLGTSGWGRFGCNRPAPTRVGLVPTRVTNMSSLPLRMQGEDVPVETPCLIAVRLVCGCVLAEPARRHGRPEPRGRAVQTGHVSSCRETSAR